MQPERRAAGRLPPRSVPGYARGMNVTRTPGSLRAVRAAAACLLVVALAPPRALADDPGVRIVRVSGDDVEGGAVVGISTAGLTVATGDAKQVVPLDDVVSVETGAAPDPPRPRTDLEAAVETWAGDRLIGKITRGDDEKLTLRSPLLGDVELDLEQVAGFEVLARVEGARGENLGERSGGTGDGESDVVHLVGGDRVDCTIVSLGADRLVCATEASDDLELPLDRVVAVRLARFEEHQPSGTQFTVATRDGSRLVVGVPTLEEGRVLSVAGIAGYRNKVRLDDVMAMLVGSDRVAYLSDLPRPKVEVKPFWKPVAGDPVVYHRPRWDRSYDNRPLSVGGRSWLKGIGVYSGTSLTWKLPEGFRELRTAVGLDDGAGPLGGVVFEVLVDGESRWKSGFVTAAEGAERGEKSPLTAPAISLEGAKTLTLRVHAGDAEDPYPVQDHADWLGAVLVR